MDSNYTVRIFTTSCKYWNEKSKQWLSDGCYVGERTTYDSTECLCYHLTMFGTDFYVPPNTIDFSTVFGKFRTLHENAAVFSTVLVILSVYALVAIYARHKDKKDLIRWGATPLEDNVPADNYYYLISVQTGIGRDTCTTSRVGFVLAGERADSGIRKLGDSKRKVSSDFS
jgi:polycystin 1L2